MRCYSNKYSLCTDLKKQSEKMVILLVSWITTKGGTRTSNMKITTLKKMMMALKRRSLTTIAAPIVNVMKFCLISGSNGLTVLLQ